MTVQTIPPTPTRAPATLVAPTKRFPPLADRSTLGHRLTGLSRQKLAREATAPDPDVRRCLAHFRLHVASMEWSNKDVSGMIGSVELEEDDDEEEDRENEKREREEREIQREGDGPAGEKGDNAQEGTESSSQTPSSSTSDVLHVSFRVLPPLSVSVDVNEETSNEETVSQPPSPKKEDGLLERSRSCLEKTVQKKHFWSSSGQCVPVRIAS